MLYEGSYSGSVSKPATDKTSWAYIGKLTFDLQNQDFNETIIGQAFKQNIDQTVAAVAKYLPF